MERREFLRNSIFASGMALVPSFMKGMEFLTESQLSGYRNVIIVQLSGGNDGLNTVVPINHDIYHKLRPNLAINKMDTLGLSSELALNKNLKEIKELYDNGEVSIINNVGYPNPNRSHFRSTDIWHTASNSNQYLTTGWLGRYLDANCTKPYQALEVDNKLSLALMGERYKGISVENPYMLRETSKGPFFESTIENTKHEMLDEDNQGYLYKTMIETHSSAAYIHEKFKTYKSSRTYPKTKFSNHLKTIAKFINSGLKTRVYYTSLNGFDTHVNQLGPQNKLLKTYSEGIGALVSDLKSTDRFKDTLILTFSEFGRRVKQNASKGTDHGTANNVFAIGGSLKKAGIFNEGPDLLNLDKTGDLKYKVDFRSVYASILNNWLEVDDKTILNQNFEKLDFI